MKRGERVSKAGPGRSGKLVLGRSDESERHVFRVEVVGSERLRARARSCKSKVVPSASRVCGRIGALKGSSSKSNWQIRKSEVDQVLSGAPPAILPYSNTRPPSHSSQYQSKPFPQILRLRISSKSSFESVLRILPAPRRTSHALQILAVRPLSSKPIPAPTPSSPPTAESSSWIKPSSRPGPVALGQRATRVKMHTEAHLITTRERSKPLKRGRPPTKHVDNQLPSDPLRVQDHG
ncbi:hypothetical protein CPC08DRAFT_729903 [Agrocybe pediades]|nr:hypothetical protein CPC08DRAFT_729903 [Agrocybe pediades]